MDIPYTGGNLLDITRSRTHVTQPNRSPHLAFLTLIQSIGPRDTQQRNGGPLNYAGLSNKSSTARQ